MNEKKWTILAINPGHNGSAALIIDGELVYYCEEERLSRMKYDGNPFRAMINVFANYKIDELIIGGTSTDFSKLPWTGEDAYSALARKFNPEIKITSMGHLHHLGHAASAFYNSGFETAAAIIIDGAGSFIQESMGENAPTTGGFETESIYQCQYPHEFNAVYKRYADGKTLYYNNGIQEFDDAVTITKAYEAVSYYLGFGFIEAGKTMGLSPYGEFDPDIPQFFINNKGNKNLLQPLYPAGAVIDENRFPYLKRFAEPKLWHDDFDLVRDLDKNMAFCVQQEAEQQVIKLIKKAVDTTGETNIVISGGFGLNCVANYKYIKHFPELTFYIDPVAHDGGTAIGLAKYAWYNYSKEMVGRPLSSLYLGTGADYNQLSVIEQNIPSLEVVDITVDDISQLIIDGNIVSMFQGASEAGPRALGNRSILFDPRRADGKMFVNTVKHREWFRPFASSVMEEYAAEWFEMESLTSSPFMMYAITVNEFKVDLIPAVTHVDNTCRVQTVSRTDNPHYYDLIESFYKKTNVPLLFNTSFNLGGQPLVDSLFDAAITLLNSDISYLYLPEINKLIKKI